MESLKSESKPCELTWMNVELSTGSKKIIHNATGQLKPGTFTAILGPSGCGKTSLLNTLAGRPESDQQVEGQIKANGRDRDQQTWPRIVSYVRQSFHAYEYQTVFETLKFSAEMKAPSGKAEGKAIDYRIQELLALLGLTEARNTFISKLSGGERMRVAIGIELVGNPSVLLVDEPLSGLDSYNALNILEILKSIAETGKTVLVTIHQPSYMMMGYFDRIMLMCQGHSTFEGTLEECIRFFEECGFELPRNATPTDFILNVLSIDSKNEQKREESVRRIKMIRDEWQYRRQENEQTVTEKLTAEATREYINVLMLFKRSIVNYLRNTNYVAARVFQKVFIALLFGLTFYNCGVDSTDVFTFRGIVSFVFQMELFGVSSPIMNAFIEEKQVITRECRSGLYTGYEAYLSKHCTEVLVNYAYALPFHTLVYFLVGFPFSARVLAVFYLVLLAIINYSVAFGLTISTLAKNTQAAQVLGATLGVTFMLYSGAFSNPKSLPAAAQWIVLLSPMHYAFRSLVHNQLSALPFSEGTDPLMVSNPKTLHDFGLDGMGVYSSLGVLFSITLVFQLLGAVVLHRKAISNLRITEKVKKEKIEV